MLVSHRWLSDYVAHGLTPEALADALTHAGLEVESVDVTGPRLDGVVVGRVLTAAPHPDADRLRVCTVDLGTPESPVQIVCGAPNVAAGQAVPVATVGTELMLPARDGSGLAPVTIKAGKIRGQVSNGMICAEDELGIGDSHDGILVLDEDAPVGQPFAAYLAERGDLPGDAVLDVAITPNRPDATSHLGVARDVAALTGQPLRVPRVDLPATGGETGGAVAVTIEDDGCTRYAAMVVRGVTVGPSPDWLRERLEAVGVRSVNNVVDVTNFVLHETGQPLHAFDLATLAGPAITVRTAHAGETLVTLDGESRELPDGALVIADAARAVAVAGVMGGRDTEVTDTTRDVLIESAWFSPSRVRRAARALGMHTDAAYRFERGVDPTAQLAAAARAAAMIAELAGGTVASGAVDVVARAHEPVTVRLRPARLARVLGAPVPDDDAERLLTAIGFGVERDAPDTLAAFADAALRAPGPDVAAREAAGAGWLVTVPPWRPDVEREIDVIEEVARLWGYGRLPMPARTAVPLVPATERAAARRLLDARRRLVALGVREVATNSLLPLATAERFADAGWTGHALPPVETLNPISQDMAALRPSLLPGLIGVASHNAARGAKALRLMEAGTVFSRAAAPGVPASPGARSAVDGYAEHTAVALIVTGAVEAPAWDRPARDADFYDLKGLVGALLDGLGVTEVEETPRLEPDALTDYALVLSHSGTRLGVVARLSAAAAPDLDAPLFAAELDWDAVAALVPDPAAVRYAPFARVPAVERDLAVVVPDAQAAGPLVETIRAAGKPLLQSVRLFDRYRGQGVPEGHQSLAFALRFGAERTLTDADVDGRVRRIVGALERMHGAVLRG